MLEAFQIYKELGHVLYEFWWAILPPPLFFIFQTLWMDYAAFYSADSWHNRLKWTMLEIIPPKEIEKGPKLMESVYSAMAGVTTTPNTFSRFKEGFYTQHRFSLELVGEEGKAHFYIRTQVNLRNLVESAIYAQYPDAQITEVADYIQRFPKILPNKKWNLYGADFEFTDAPPMPIKTYDKFEESVTGEMIDPMASLVEVIGTLGPGQHIWLQYVLEPLLEPWAYEKKQKDVVNKITGRGAAEPNGGIGKDLTDVISNLPKGLFQEVEFKKLEKKEEQPLEFRLTPMEKEKLKALEENLGKNSFKTKMRLIYFSPVETFNMGYISSFVGAIKQFNDMNYNQMKPEDITKTYGKIFFTKTRADFRKRKLYKRYKDRDMDDVKIVLSTKELATVYHFPDMGVKSPSVTRVPSKLGAAPPNLPVG